MKIHTKFNNAYSLIIHSFVLIRQILV